MTFHFPHMAPPGADMRRDTPVACWLRDARSGKLVRHWLARPAPAAPAGPRDAQLRPLLTRHAELRAG